MTQIETSITLFHAILEKDLRLAICYELIDDNRISDDISSSNDFLSTYHFIKEDISLRVNGEIKVVPHVRCCMYTSIKTDPLRISGSLIELTTFLSKYAKPEKFHSPYGTFERQSVYLYPLDWYPYLSEKDNTQKIEAVSKLLPELRQRAKELEKVYEEFELARQLEEQHINEERKKMIRYIGYGFVRDEREVEESRKRLENVRDYINRKLAK